jgi:hypothetical protein
LFIIKYSAAVLTGIYGVYATLTDFREEKKGKKVLSRKGYAGILLLAVSTVLSLSSDGIKDYRDHLQEQADQHERERVAKEQEAIHESVSAELSKSLEISKNLGAALHTLDKTSEVVKNTAKVSIQSLHESQRGATPLSLRDLSASVEFSMPAENQLIFPYLSRARTIGSGYSPSYTSSDVGFPSSLDGELPLRRFLLQMELSLRFLRNPPKVFDGGDYDDLDLVISCDEIVDKATTNVVRPSFKQNGDPYDLVVGCRQGTCG